MPATFGIIDLFAGPGGLGEGFASLVENGHSPFRVGISVEKEVSAHRTLTLRAFLREYRSRHGGLPDQFIDFYAGRVSEPDWSEVDVEAWRVATNETRRLELGTKESTTTVDDVIANLKGSYDDTILIGGPPCQSYSLVGRARFRGKSDYIPEKDERLYLFREYILVLKRLRPAAFVMENVKGILSSKVDNGFIFEILIKALSSLGTGRGHFYELRAIRVEDGKASLQEAGQPSDFIVRAEQFGVPQRRHRIIIVGIRSDLASGTSNASIVLPRTTRTVADVIGNLPPLRSGLSRGHDSATAWRETVVEAARFLASIHRGKHTALLGASFSTLAKTLKAGALPLRMSTTLPANYGISNDDLLRWLEKPELQTIAQHETRGHMAPDLVRYMFAAMFGKKHRYSPKSADFPLELSPSHRNWHSGVFNDRFRVQLADEASTTVTSHISKDGHYFIHHNPSQCRSLTVREAARLQTFPDDYLFLGTRTQQYVQVGNAVPPFLAYQIAHLLRVSLTQ